jgi:hypothetical protein
MAFAVGPISIFSGWFATLLVNNVGLPDHLTKDKTAAWIVTGTTFAIGSGVTWATHQKWFTGLWKWWEHNFGKATPMPAPLVNQKAAAEVVQAVVDKETK